MGQNLQVNHSNPIDTTLQKPTVKTQSKDDNSINNAKKPTTVDTKSNKNGLRGTCIPSFSDSSPTANNEEAKKSDPK